MNGTYKFVYSGAVSVGMGFFVIKDNVITGADLYGGRYHGQITSNEKNNGFDVIVDMFVPAGTSLVQSASYQEINHTKSKITLHLKPDFDNGEPITMFIPPGHVTFMIKRTRDEEGIYADGFSVTITPQPSSRT